MEDCIGVGSTDFELEVVPNARQILLSLVQGAWREPLIYFALFAKKDGFDTEIHASPVVTQELICGFLLVFCFAGAIFIMATFGEGSENSVSLQLSVSVDEEAIVL